MQLGARWRVGDPPHRGVPSALYAAIAEQERAHPGAGSWTLTWLEGRPRCSLDDLVMLELTASGETRISALGGAGDATPQHDDDDWLA